MSMQSPLGVPRLGSAKNRHAPLVGSAGDRRRTDPLGDLVCHRHDRPDGCCIRNVHRMDVITFNAIMMVLLIIAPSITCSSGCRS